LLAGDELAAPDRPEVRRHLLGCPSCRRRLEELRAALRVLHLAAAESPVAADAPSIWPELSRQIRESRRPSPRRSLAFSWSWTGPALALAAGLLLAFLVRVPRPGPAPNPPRTPASTPIAVVPVPAPAASPDRRELSPITTRPKKAAPTETIAKARGRSKKDLLAAEARPSSRGDADADRTAVAEQPTH
jgi:anti-sigma factor RsiW